MAEDIQKECEEIAKRIYDLDTLVYKNVGSLLGRTIIGDRSTFIKEMKNLLLTRPHSHELRNDLALIGNMARTIKDKDQNESAQREYDEIKELISRMYAKLASIDILDAEEAALNKSNLKQHFSKEDHLIICIGRTHGSAGTDIGFALSEALKINYYDAEILKEVLKRLEAEKDFEINNDSFLTGLKKKSKSYHGIKAFFKSVNHYHGLPKRDAVFFNQSDLICDMAKKEDFIVMGRCADVVLRNKGIPHISIFITAPFDQRVRRMMELKKLDYKHASRLLKKLDKMHEGYYQFYTSRKWGSAVNYDLCINSANYGIEESVELIERLINQYAIKR